MMFKSLYEDKYYSTFEESLSTKFAWFMSIRLQLMEWTSWIYGLEEHNNKGNNDRRNKTFCQKKEKRKNFTFSISANLVW